MKKIKMILGGLLLAGCIQAAQKPNVIIIMADDLGWRDLACYGSTFYETPHIDHFAQSALRFTEGYAAHPACSPTRSSVLTGQYPTRTGFNVAAGHLVEKRETVERTSADKFYRGIGPDTMSYLDTSYYTLGEAMQDAGYATSFFGKWHMGHKPYIPEAHGFETVYGGRWHAGPPGKKGSRRYFPPWDDCETLPSNLPANTHVDDYITDVAVDYIAEHKAKPFFMCYWPYSVHGPFQSKPKLIEKWKKKIDPNDPQRSPTMAAMIEVLDENVGRLMAALEKNGLVDNTIVFFLSDNGGVMYTALDGVTPTNNYPLRGGKCINYEGGVRIPFMVRWPGVTQAGHVDNRSIVSTTDLYATILEMTGQPLRPADHKDSVSFVPVLKGQAYDRGPLIFDTPAVAPHAGSLPNTTVRDGDWKLIRTWFDSPDMTHRSELFNLRSDLSETQNVAEDYPEVCQRLNTFIDKYFAQEGILQYHPNADYDGLRVSRDWAALSPDGHAEMNNGVMRMNSDPSGFGIYTPFSSHFSEAVFHFEARSSKPNKIKFQWTSTTQKKRSEEASQTVKTGEEWTSFSVPINNAGRRKAFYLTLSQGGSVELRNLHLATPEGTVMMTYNDE